MAQQTINTPRETTHQRIADALEDMVDKIVDTSSASNVDYDNTQSGLSANKVQGAVDELKVGVDSKIPLSQKGAYNGVAELDSNGKVPSSQLPSYVDDVVEYATKSAFPSTGESGKIYVDLSTNLTYRWGGTEYVEISSSLALGETSSTAYRGDRGKSAYNHSQTTGNPHGTTKSDVGLGNVDNTSDANKPISTATQNALNQISTALNNLGLTVVNGKLCAKYNVYEGDKT